MRNVIGKIGALACCLTVGCSNSKSATSELPGASTGEWFTRAPLPTARQEMPSALIANRIYTPGGYNANGQASTVLEVYDVAADRWSAGPALPEARHHPGVAAAAGQVFLTGGYTPTGAASATVLFSIPPRSAGARNRRCPHRAPLTSPWSTTARFTR